MFKVSFQPIPALQYEPLGDVWAWCVSEGMIIIARFGNRDDAEAYADWRIACTRSPEEASFREASIEASWKRREKVWADALAAEIELRKAAEAALQAFVDGKLIVKP